MYNCHQLHKGAKRPQYNIAVFSPESGKSQPPQIIDINPQDTRYIQSALDIYNQALGQNYVDPESIINYIKDKEKYIVLGSIKESQLVGVMLAYTLETAESTDYENGLNNYGVVLPLSRFKVGLIKSVAVEEKFRRQGIGTNLTLETIDRFKLKKCDALFAVSWVSNRPDSSQKMFESLGFQNVLRIPNYWTKDSIEDGYMCPVCGNPCKCVAIFYFRHN